MEHESSPPHEPYETGEDIAERIHAAMSWEELYETLESATLLEDLDTGKEHSVDALIETIDDIRTEPVEETIDALTNAAGLREKVRELIDLDGAL